MNGKLEIQRQCKISTIRLQEDHSATYVGRFQFYSVPMRVKQGTHSHISQTPFDKIILVSRSHSTWKPKLNKGPALEEMITFFQTKKVSTSKLLHEPCFFEVISVSSFQVFNVPNDQFSIPEWGTKIWIRFQLNLTAESTSLYLRQRQKIYVDFTIDWFPLLLTCGLLQ